jgi:cadmium resistance protein CadD (predicted permease)
MNEIIYALPTGFSAFCATNLDDILILLLFFLKYIQSSKKDRLSPVSI